MQQSRSFTLFLFLSLLTPLVLAQSGWGAASIPISTQVSLEQSDSPPDLTVDTVPMERVLTQEQLFRCSDYIFNAQRLIPRWHREGKRDSINMAIAFVQDRCSRNPFGDLKRILDISDGELTDSGCDSAILREVIYVPYRYIWDCFPDLGIAQFSDTAYYSFIRNLAAATADATPSGTSEHLVASYYAERIEEIRASLSQGLYSGTCYQRQYDAIYQEVLRKRYSNRLHLAAGAGVWVPNGAADILGPKMAFLMTAGYRWRRIGFDLSMELRFIDGTNRYRIKKGSEFDETKTFVGVYFGLEPNLLLFRAGRFESEVFAGIGYDGFSPRAPEEDDWESVNSLNLSLGATQRLFVNRTESRYLAVQFRYNFVDYDSEGGSDLSGNAISVNLLYGGLGNSSAIWDLERLGHFEK